MLPPQTKIDGRYEIVAEVGQGGMGVVYRAVDATLNRTVAIKLLAADHLRDDGSRRRFLREGRAMSSLNHSGICRFYHVGLLGDGRPYIVMEFLEGCSLRSILDHEEPLQAKRVVDWFLQLCDALEVAHNAGIVHRDIKPSNILILTTEQGEQAKLLDFGLAKTMDEATLTESGALIGTAQYMSPEQCRGLPVDARSDQYSLACVFYECLAGHPAFNADNSVGMLHKHLHEEVKPLQPSPERCSDARFCRAVNRIIDQSMAKNANDRYDSIAHMREDLLLVSQANYQSLSARRERMPSKSFRGLMGSYIVCVLVLIGFWTQGNRWLSGLTSWYVDAGHSSSLENVRKLSSELSLAGFTESARSMLVGALSCRRIKQDNLRFALLCSDLMQPELSVSGCTDYSNSTLRSLGRLPVGGKRMSAVELASFRLICQRLASAAQSGRLVIDRNVIADGNRMVALGAGTRAAVDVLSFLVTLRSKHPGTDKLGAELDHLIADCLVSQGKYDEALVYAENRAKCYDAHWEDCNPQDLISSRFDAGALARRCEDLPKAKAYLVQAYRITKEANSSWLRADILRELLTCINTAPFAAAPTGYEVELQEIFRTRTLVNRAAKLYQENRGAEARRVLGKARMSLAMRPDEVPVCHKAVVLSINDPAGLNEASLWLAEAESIPCQPMTKLQLADLRAYVLTREGKNVEAEIHCRRALSEYTKELREAPIHAVSLNRQLAESLMAQGRPKEAEAAFVQAIAQMKSIKDPTRENQVTLQQLHDQLASAHKAVK